MFSRLLERTLRSPVRRYLHRRFHVSFSQSGEDLQLAKLLRASTPGTYVDVGCWHPVKASNSYHFYLRGWRGLCVDPNPKLRSLFAAHRSGDVFVEAAIMSGVDRATYFSLTEEVEDGRASMNSLDASFVREVGVSQESILESEVRCVRLDELLDRHQAELGRLDFFDIDVEGFDLEVLRTNDWERFRPRVVMIESDNPFALESESACSRFLHQQGYELVAKSALTETVGNLFFVDTAEP